MSFLRTGIDLTLFATSSNVCSSSSVRAGGKDCRVLKQKSCRVKLAMGGMDQLGLPSLRSSCTIRSASLPRCFLKFAPISLWLRLKDLFPGKAGYML